MGAPGLRSHLPRPKKFNRNPRMFGMRQLPNLYPFADRTTDEREEGVFPPIQEGEKVPFVAAHMESGTFMDVELSMDDMVQIGEAHSVSNSLGPTEPMGVLLEGKGPNNRKSSLKPNGKHDNIPSQKREKSSNQSKWRRLKDRAHNGEVLGGMRPKNEKWRAVREISRKSKGYPRNRSLG
ncbi:hypothetical protein FCV25MIE_29053 [Fagus crenata]